MVRVFIGLCFIAIVAAFTIDRESYFIPEYSCYFRQGVPGEKITKLVPGSRYISINMPANSKQVEVKCYRSKDSTLAEWGWYSNRDSVITRRSTSRQAGTDVSRTVHTRHYYLFRTGVWKFYDENEKEVRTENYR